MRHRSFFYDLTWFCLQPFPHHRPVTPSGEHYVIDLGHRCERLQYRPDRIGD
jgi:hypothetical protein